MDPNSEYGCIVTKSISEKMKIFANMTDSLIRSDALRY